MKLLMENWKKFVSLNELTMDRLLDTKYEVFVKYLGQNIRDPKILALIDAGQDDGDKTDDRFTFSTAAVPVKALRPTQMEVDIDKSLKFPMSIQPGEFIKFVASEGPFTLKGPIVTFNEKYVIDGHHRWSSLFCCNSNASITNINMAIGGLEPLDALKAVQAAIGTEIGKIPVNKVKGSNLFKMKQGDIKNWIIATIKADGGVNAPLVNLILKNPKVLAKIKAAAGLGAQDSPSPEALALEGLSESDTNSMAQAMEAKAIITQYLPAYIWANVSALQKNSQPVPNSPRRDFMPQTDDVNWTKPLAAGDIDIVPPFADGTTGQKKAAE
jgi:hypothetical protein